MKELFSITTCSRRLGVATFRINYALAQGKLVDTQLRVAGKRVYTAKDLKRMAHYFGIKLNPDKENYE
jgi:hypothetical protein